MALICSKDAKPELIEQRYLFVRGYCYLPDFCF